MLAGCGGTRLDAHEPKGSYDMAVVHASFPTAQAVARPATLDLQVRNTGTRTVPNVAVSVDSFNYRSTFPGNADPVRPLWVIEQGPGAIAKPKVETEEVSTGGNATTVYVNTWALGPLPAGQTRTFSWRVVPVTGGTHTVHYRLAAGLAGKARAQAAQGSSIEGQFTVDIAGKPAARHVNPATGQVEIGAIPAVP
jgi:hypothetical protein